jgi:hypothetical protein
MKVSFFGLVATLAFMTSLRADQRSALLSLSGRSTTEGDNRQHGDAASGGHGLSVRLSRSLQGRDRREIKGAASTGGRYPNWRQYGCTQ